MVPNRYRRVKCKLHLVLCGDLRRSILSQAPTQSPQFSARHRSCSRNARSLDRRPSLTPIERLPFLLPRAAGSSSCQSRACFPIVGCQCVAPCGVFRVLNQRFRYHHAQLLTSTFSASPAPRPRTFLDAIKGDDDCALTPRSSTHGDVRRRHRAGHRHCDRG